MVRTFVVVCSPPINIYMSKFSLASVSLFKHVTYSVKYTYHISMASAYFENSVDNFTSR